MMYSPGPVDLGRREERSAAVGRLEERLVERLVELERLVEALEGVPDEELVVVLDRAVAVLADVNAGLEEGVRASEGEARELGGLLERVDFGPFDEALERAEQRGAGGG